MDVLIQKTDNKISLISGENPDGNGPDPQKFEVSLKFCQLSEVVNMTMQDRPDDKLVHCENINGKELSQIVEWAKLHDYTPPQVKIPIESGNI